MSQDNEQETQQVERTNVWANMIRSFVVTAYNKVKWFILITLPITIPIVWAYIYTQLPQTDFHRGTYLVTSASILIGSLIGGITAYMTYEPKGKIGICFEEPGEKLSIRHFSHTVLQNAEYVKDTPNARQLDGVNKQSDVFLARSWDIDDKDNCTFEVVWQDYGKLDETFASDDTLKTYYDELVPKAIALPKVIKNVRTKARKAHLKGFREAVTEVDDITEMNMDFWQELEQDIQELENLNIEGNKEGGTWEFDIGSTNKEQEEQNIKIVEPEDIVKGGNNG